jgi:hypothetical protein
MPFIWVILAFIILLLLQRWIHTHLHGLSLLLTGKPERAVYLYALVLFPGVLLHELSHWLTATLLGIRTGKFSLLPQRQKDGSITLGYVEYYKDSGLGPIRESLVGGAPLLTGTAVILLISYTVLDVTRLAEAVQTGHIDNLYLALDELLATPYFFLWLYLLFAIGNAMMPSPSDRRAWPAFLGISAVLILAALPARLYRSPARRPGRTGHHRLQLSGHRLRHCHCGGPDLYGFYRAIGESNRPYTRRLRGV